MPPKPKTTTTKPSKEQQSSTATSEREDIAWLRHPARQLLKDAFLKGEIPLDWNRRPKDIFDKYQHTEEFQGLSYDLKFQNCLRSIRDIVKNKKDRVDQDQAAYDIFRQNFPVRKHNDVGDLRWHGSLAEHFLKLDMKANLHVGTQPAELRETREEYMEFSLERFRKHIDQEKRLWKLHNLLKAKAAQKEKGGNKKKELNTNETTISGSERKSDNTKTSSNNEHSKSDSDSDSMEVHSDASSRHIARYPDFLPESLSTLQPATWLSDDVINGYLKLLNLREESNIDVDPTYRPSFCYSCFFWPLVTQRDHETREGVYSYSAVQKVSKHVFAAERFSRREFHSNVFSLRLLVVPININNEHWACAVVSFRDRTIQFLDSMSSSSARYGRNYLHYIEAYLRDEYKKLYRKADSDLWTLHGSDVTEVQQQANGFDCGVFVCLFADNLLRGQPPFFSFTTAQAREHIALAILRGKLDDDDNDDEN